MFGFSSSSKIKKLEYEVNDLRERLYASIKDSSEWRETALYHKKRWEFLQRSRNELVELINRKGGQEFLDYARIPGKNTQQNVQQKPMFTENELKTLLVLVHPDKHGTGRHGEMAEELFKAIHKLMK